jgi:hypothetical protein
MADRLGRLLDPYPTAPYVRALPIVLRPRPGTITFDTPSAMIVCLGLVRFALCGEHRSQF